MYLLYAAGEIILAVAGILLALQIDNWNEERKTKELEQKVLIQFQSDLNADIEAIHEVNLWYDKTINSCEVLVHHLKKSIPFHDSLKTHFDLWNDFQLFNYRSGAIQFITILVPHHSL